jgi:hypothetical protein
VISYEQDTPAGDGTRTVGTLTLKVRALRGAFERYDEFIPHIIRWQVAGLRRWAPERAALPELDVEREGPYRRTMPRALWRSKGGRGFL